MARWALVNRSHQEDETRQGKGREGKEDKDEDEVKRVRGGKDRGGLGQETPKGGQELGDTCI